MVEYNSEVVIKLRLKNMIQFLQRVKRIRKSGSFSLISFDYFFFFLLILQNYKIEIIVFLIF